MSIFGRNFAVEKITDQVLAENTWLKDMLFHWRPAGDALRRDILEEDPRHLRLAIRNGYFNLYRGGQSVAKIGFGSNGRVQARIHNKYVHGKNGNGQT